MPARFSRQLRFIDAIVTAHETLANHQRALNDLVRMMLEQAQEAELFAQLAVTKPPPPVRADDSDPPTGYASIVVPEPDPTARLPLPGAIPFNHATRIVEKYTPDVFKEHIRMMWRETSSDEDRAEVRERVSRAVPGLLTLHEADELLRALALDDEARGA